MSSYLLLSRNFLNWEPFEGIDAGAQMLWLALYTTGPVPGLWYGSIHAMSDASRKSPDDTLVALDTLLERGLAEYDRKARVLRLCAPDGFDPLPDAGEWPHNADALRGWWNRFQAIPQCAVRDAHVTTIRWIVDRGYRDRPTQRRRAADAHETVWIQTFGKVHIPPPRRRGVRRLASDDTSTAIQPSLFSAPERSMTHHAVDNSTAKVSDKSHETGIVREPVDNSRIGSDSRCRGVGVDTHGHTVSTPTRDQRSDLLSSSGTGAPRSPEPPGRSPTPEPGPGVQVVAVHEQGMDVETVIQAIAMDSRGKFDPNPSESRRAALSRQIPDLAAHDLGFWDLRVLGRFLAANPLAVPVWLTLIFDRADLAGVVLEARSWQQSHGISFDDESQN